jgi:hypothetical protein
MGTLPFSFGIFFLSLMFGSSFFSWLVKPSQTGPGFDRLLIGCNLFFSLSALIIFTISKDWTYAGLALLSTFVYTLWYVAAREQRGYLERIYYALLLILWIYVLHLCQLRSLGKGKLTFLNLMLSGLSLGLVHYLMLLGHYYLVVPKLTTKPLIVGLKFLLGILILKMCVGFYSGQLFLYVKNFYTFFFPNVEVQSFTLPIWDLAFFFMQFLCLYVCIPILSVFTLHLAKIRSTQSATGILYVMEFFVLIGEMISIYFCLFLGVCL